MTTQQQPPLLGFAETPDEPRGPNRERALSAICREAAQCHQRRAIEAELADELDAARRSAVEAAKNRRCGGS